VPRANRVITQGPAQAAALARVARGFLRALGLQGCELSLSLVDDAQIRAVNRAWRQKDKPTDVLSFPAGDQPLGEGQLRPLGDVVISLETARARAREEGRPLKAELARYLAHGLLHLLGHDHHQKAEAARMAREEKRLLGAAGMVAVDKPRQRKPLSAARKRK
jgi:probable rRNA maturation factor